MTSKNRERLLKTLRQMKLHTEKGVPGVLKIVGKEPGVVLGISAFTHGNEPSGLAAIDFLLHKFRLAEKLERGTVYFVINNLLAAENYLSQGPHGKKHKYRFIDKNMNRLPENLSRLHLDTRYEVRRARELLPIWRTFDIGFDIHSTSKESAPMLVGGRIPLDLVHDFPIETMLTNIDVVQIGLPAFGFYGSSKKTIPSFEIEAGGHENTQSLKRAQECTLRLLRNLGMINSTPFPRESAMEKPARRRLEYRVSGSVLFPDPSYRFARSFADGEKIARGDTLAFGKKNIVAKKNGHTFFCPKGAAMTSIAEEALFLTDPVIVHTV